MPMKDLEPVKGLITLCMHCWTVKADTLQRRIASNYVQIISTLVRCLDDRREFRRNLDASHSAEVSGMLQQCQPFHFFFSLKTCICIFQVLDKFSTMIQSNNVTVSSAVHFMSCAMEELKQYMHPVYFNKFWDELEISRIRLNIICSNEEWISNHSPDVHLEDEPSLSHFQKTNGIIKK
jgi:hypothetical protein